MIIHELFSLSWFCILNSESDRCISWPQDRTKEKVEAKKRLWQQRPSIAKCILHILLLSADYLSL